jgi:predicted N-acetyltransferase YhbS
MSLTVRRGTPQDAESCGSICHSAFRAIAEKHGFPSDIPSAEVGVGVISKLLSHPGFYSAVAESDGKIVGSNFLDERSSIAGVGPITIDPAAQNRGIGRTLMEDVLSRAHERRFPGVRLLQAAYHPRSLSLYAKLGFEARELVATMQGSAILTEVPGLPVRAASDADADECNRLCRRVHGHDRAGELADAIEQGAATVVERRGSITGYSTGIAFFGHSVAETNDDLKALITAATEFQGPGFLLPVRNGELLRWCLQQRLQVVHMMTLMTTGLYSEPDGPYLPSVLY